MKTARSGRLAAILLACGTRHFPASSLARAAVPFSAVIEKVEFNGVSAEIQRLIERRVDRELNRIHKGLTFTYKPGSTSATARLIISGDC